MRSVTVPASALPTIQRLIKFTPAEFDAFLAALTQASPTLRADKFWSHVAPHLKEVKSSVVETVLKEIFLMHNTKERMGGTIEEFADALVRGVRSLKSKTFPFEKEDQVILKNRIRKIFEGQKGFDITTKSVDVLVDQNHVFYTSKILTDIRPVFNKSGDSIDAAVIVHNLKISYGVDAETKEFYVALDTSDIHTLRGVLDRAETKAKCLEELLQKSGISYLDANE